MPYNMSDTDYANEVARKEAAGISLTQPKDTAAFARAATAATAAATPAPASGGSGSITGSGGGSPGGYAYTDKYGFPHVVSDIGTARQYAKPDTDVYGYTGSYGGGYATNPEGGRVALGLPGAINFGNVHADRLTGRNLDTGLESSADYNRYIGSGYVAPTPGPGTGTVAKAPLDAYQHLDRTWPGGAQQYIQGQQERYNQAVQSQDVDLINRLTADAARVGYSFGAPAEENTLDRLRQNKEQKTSLFQFKDTLGGKIQDLLAQVQQMSAQPVGAEDYPGYAASMEAAKGDIAKATQQVMENMNRRGILNSTVTSDTSQELGQQIMAQLIPTLIEKAYGLRQNQIQNLMGMVNQLLGIRGQEYSMAQDAYNRQLEIQKQAIEEEERKIQRAYDEIKTMGYVTNYASIVLGVPVNTPSFEAQKFVQQQLDKLEAAKMQIEGQLAKTQMQQEGAMSRTQYTQGQINARRGAGGGGGGGKKPTAKEEATSYIAKYKSKFRRPIDMVEQARRNAEAGKMSTATYNEIKKYIESNHEPYAWRK